MDHQFPALTYLAKRASSLLRMSVIRSNPVSELIEVPDRQLLALPEVQKARAFIRASRAPATIRAYASDWRRFLAWCEGRSLNPLPALPGTVALFLSMEADDAKSATLTRRAAAIRYMHELQRHASPTADPEVQAVMAGIRRTNGTRPEQKHLRP